MANRVTFEEWMGKVDGILLRKVYLTSMDLPDIDYRELYDANETPAYAARQAIQEALTN